MPESINLLRQFTPGTKYISFSTKLKIGAPFAAFLAEIDQELRQKGGRLSVSISIPCAWDIHKVERGTATANERYENLRLLQTFDIARVASLRPVLSDVGAEEIHEIIDRSSEFCADYTDGPLYLKVLGRFARGDYLIRRGRVPWLPHDRSRWYILDAVTNRQLIRARVERQGLAFLGVRC